ncbi:hypothetical protein Tco_1022089, partial [Tanacetum coccineum]
DSASALTKAAPKGEKLSTQENMDSKITVLAPAQGEQQPNKNTPDPATAEEAKADDDKGKGVAFKENPLKELIPLIDEGGVDPLPITKISYKVNNFTKEASMRITKDNQPLNLIVYDKFILKMLGFSEWVEAHALTSKLTAFELPPDEKKVGLKRKRKSKLIHEVFVKENIIVDGMQRNLTLQKEWLEKLAW